MSWGCLTVVRGMMHPYFLAYTATHTYDATLVTRKLFFMRKIQPDLAGKENQSFDLPTSWHNLGFFFPIKNSENHDSTSMKWNTKIKMSAHFKTHPGHFFTTVKHVWTATNFSLGWFAFLFCLSTLAMHFMPSLDPLLSKKYTWTNNLSSQNKLLR